MNLLALPLEREQIYSIKRRFPGFSGKVPEEARFWSEEDLEAFFDSNGQKQPRESARPVAETCPLLSRIRLELAKQRIDEPTIEYAAFSRYVQGLREDWYRYRSDKTSILAVYAN